MKIAVVTNSFPSLSEKFVINQIAALKELLPDGSEVTVIAAVPSASPTAPHTAYTSRRLDTITENLDIPRSPLKRCAKALRFMAPLAFTHPVLLARCFDRRRYQTMARNFKLVFFLRFFLKKRKKGERYDIVHCQFGQNGFIGAYLFDAKFCADFMVTFHGSDINVFPRKFKGRVYSYPFLKAAAVTCGSRFIKNRLVENGCPEEKIQVIPQGIFPDEYPPPQPAGETSGENRGEDGFTALSVGRLLPLKGFEYSIQAAASSGVTYIIAGGGSASYAAELQRLVRSLHAEERIILAGAKNDSELKELYARSDCLLFPSVRAENGAEEGQGLVVQEAEGAGLPVIASDIGGVGEGLVNGVTGFLVPEKDARAIAEKLDLLKADETLRREMGRKARAFAEENYDCRRLTEKLIALYRAVAKSRAGRRDI